MYRYAEDVPLDAGDDFNGGKAGPLTYGLQRLDHAVGNVENLLETVDYITGFTGRVVTHSTPGCVRLITRTYWLSSLITRTNWLLSSIERVLFQLQSDVIVKSGIQPYPQACTSLRSSPRRTWARWTAG